MLSRVIYPKRQGRRVATALAAVTLISGLLLVASSALAVHDEGLFELDTSASAAICAPLPAPCGDANVADDPAGGADDWANVYKSATGLGTAGPDHAFGRAFITDPVSSAENSFYTGGGSKDVRDIPDWRYATTNDVVPDKDDIAHAFAAAYEEDDDVIIYFGIDRYDNNGDAETGFWFFEDPVSLGPNGTFTGTHSVGDVLVLADWGGSNPVGQITVYDWVGGKNPLRLIADNAGADCSNVLGGDNICAVVNRQTVSQPWPFVDKAGSTTIRPLELFEAGINVTQLFGEDRCFSSFLANTRSSHSTTAQLKDFALGSFEQCGAAISITPSAINRVGETHTFTVHVTRSVGGTQSGAQGVFPTVTLTATNGAVITGKVDNCAGTGTNASGDCTVSFTSNNAGIVTGHATAAVTIGEDTFNVATDGVAPNSGDAVKRFVDAKIAVTPLTDTNEVNDPHTITATVQQDDGLAANVGGGDTVSGFGPAPNGTLVTFSLPTNTANASFVGGVNTCTTTSGSCSVAINTTTAGPVDIHATTTFSVSGLSLTRATGTGGNNGADANKVYVDAWITITPPLETNTVGDPHTFTVTVKQAVTSPTFVNVPDGTKPTVTLTNSAGATFSISSNTCATTGTVDGQCTVTFTSPTAGTVTGHASVSLTLAGLAVTRQTDGVGLNSGDAVKHFVAGSIAWTKVDNAGVLQGGATFEVCKTHDFTLPAGPFEDVTDVCFSVVDNGLNDEDADAGEFLVSGLSLGRYTVRETVAPAGFIADPDTVTVELTPGDSNKTISTAFVNTRPVLKITGFGYTNSATGTPLTGVVNGTAVYTVNLHNYGSADAVLSNSSLVVTHNASSGTVTCTGGATLAISGTIAPNADGGPYTLSCTYAGINDGAVITATLTVNTLTNGTTRAASGSPATISFTVQAD